jgi:hypothetical protein
MPQLCLVPMLLSTQALMLLLSAGIHFASATSSGYANSSSGSGQDEHLHHICQVWPAVSHHRPCKWSVQATKCRSQNELMMTLTFLGNKSLCACLVVLILTATCVDLVLHVGVLCDSAVHQNLSLRQLYHCHLDVQLARFSYFIHV